MAVDLLARQMAAKALNGGGGGTEVVANPTLAGTEADLTGIQVGETKYKVPNPGTTVVANPTLAGTESDLVGLQVGDTKYKVPAGGGGTSAPKLVAPLAELLDPTTIDITPGHSCLIFNQCQCIDSSDAVMYWWTLVPPEYVNRITEFSSENPLVVTFLVCPTIDNFQYVNSHIGYQDVEVSDLTDPNYLQVLFYWDNEGQQVDGEIASTITTICTPFDLCTMTIFVSVDEDASESVPLPSVKQNCFNAILSADDCAGLFDQFTFSFE